MLFNSFEFLLLFLPGVFLVHRLALRGRQSLVLGFLAAMSFAFYAWWDWRYVPLLAGSVTANYYIGRFIAWRRQCGHQFGARLGLAGGVLANLLLLGHYKYFAFVLSVLHETAFNPNTHAIPLGISFFTFTQIAYLADTYAGKSDEKDPLGYALFVTWFPHLIAGPILHHREMMTQFRGDRIRLAGATELAAGLTVFTIGLAKKVLIADNIGAYLAAGNAASAFTRAAQGLEIGFFDGWNAALGYTLQLYFDFSGYSDMAIGLSLMFGVRLPLNFDSPYKALNIAEFWRRWHMTLSRFLREYLYIPLGGNRVGPSRHLVNLFLTMLIGGIWHGAGWTFIVWGALHGAYLVTHTLWSKLRSKTQFSLGLPMLVSNTGARALTFLAVVIGWVFFRADSVAAAMSILRGMFGLQGFAVAQADQTWLQATLPFVESIGLSVDPSVPPLAALAVWVVPGLLLVWLAPNTQQIMRAIPIALDIRRADRALSGRALLVWRPSLAWAGALSLLFVVSIFGLIRPAQFLYFQF